MEDFYPEINPAQGLNKLIEQKKRKIINVDKIKHARFYNETWAEIRELEYYKEGLSSLTDFDILVTIQKSIHIHQALDNELLNIRIPLAASPKNSHAVLLDFTERRQHE